MKDRRLGRFYIYTSLIDSDPEIVRDVMGRCIILRAEHLIYEERMEYIATSPDFDVLELGLMIYDYEVVINEPSGMIEFKKQF